MADDNTAVPETGGGDGGTSAKRDVSYTDNAESKVGERDDFHTSTRNRKCERHGYFAIRIPYWLCGCGTLVSILVAATAVLVGFVSFRATADLGDWMQEVQDRVGKGGVDLFRNYDLNRDGYLSIYEFEPLIKHLKNLSSAVEEASSFYC